MGGGGGKHYVYPLHVWSPTGGWFTNPSNWKANTAIVGLGLTAVVGAVWAFSAEKEFRYQYPRHWVPSMKWARQFDDPNFKAPPRGDDF
ncbi:hypothetical protein H4R34_000849 [Dimargaris verticillata]|uniref:Uncharacterized protein n=1 Tax=Dimargaris verticillata TaxID=2761393 RepID=A0A9W8EEB7_9FUNG|nr:hypothetical protein H4R34_000849 [Dimargaris verticillata]